MRKLFHAFILPLILWAAMPAQAQQIATQKTGNCLALAAGAVVSEPCVAGKAAQISVHVPVVVNGATYYQWTLGKWYVRTGPAQTSGNQTKYYLQASSTVGVSDEFLWSSYKATPTSTTFQLESKAVPGRCVNTEQDSTTAGAKVEVWDCGGAQSNELARKFFVWPSGVQPTRPAYPIVNATTLGKSTGQKANVGAPCDCDTGTYSAPGVTCQVAGTSMAAVCRDAAGIRLAWLQPPVAVARSAGVSITVATAATISGTAQEGSTLTATPATFSNFTGTVIGQWLCSGSPIAGQTGPTWTPTKAQVGCTPGYRSTADTVSSTATLSTTVAAAASAPPPTTTAAAQVDPASITMGQVLTTKTAAYPNAIVGDYRAVNNVWGGQYGTGWSQSVGIKGLQLDGTVAFRLKGSWPNSTNEDVISFPQVAYGRSASFAPTGGQLPKLLSSITSLKTKITSIQGSCSGLGHLSYDNWLGVNANALATADRRVEIMMPVMSCDGYGVPTPWEAAGAGRTADNLGSTGRNPKIYVGRVTLGGRAWDVYHGIPNARVKNADGTWSNTRPSWYTGGAEPTDSWTLPWHFVVFQAVTKLGTGSHEIEWKPFNDYIVAQGWANNSMYANDVELGYEPVPNPSSVFDVTVSGFKVTVNETTQAAAPAYTLPTSTTQFAANATSGPIVATTGQVIEGKRISNPTGPCITVPDGVHGVVIRNNDIGPCGETTTSATLLDWANDVGVLIAGYDVLIGGNTIHDVRAGVYAQGAEHPIVVDRNLVWGIRGPEPRGEMVQLNTVTSTGAGPYAAAGSAQTRITNNVSDKTLSQDTGYRNPETRDNMGGRITGYVDHVNLYGSSGTSALPIRVACNKFRGGDDTAGSGMIVGDNGGGWVIAEDNIMMMTTNVGGVGCAGCTDTIVRRNVVYAPGADSASNTSGAFYSKTDDGAFSSARVQFLNNRAWVRSWLYGGTGELSAAWYEDGTTTGLTLTGNNFQDSTLTAAIWDTTPAACPA